MPSGTLVPSTSADTPLWDVLPSRAVVSPSRQDATVPAVVVVDVVCHALATSLAAANVIAVAWGWLDMDVGLDVDVGDRVLDAAN